MRSSEGPNPFTSSAALPTDTSAPHHLIAHLLFFRTGSSTHSPAEHYSSNSGSTFRGFHALALPCVLNLSCLSVRPVSPSQLTWKQGSVYPGICSSVNSKRLLTIFTSGHLISNSLTLSLRAGLCCLHPVFLCPWFSVLFCAYCWRQLLSSNYKHHDFFRAFLWHCYVISAQENLIFSDI